MLRQYELVERVKAYDPDADEALEIGDTIQVRRGVRKERLDLLDRYYAAQRDVAR